MTLVMPRPRAWRQNAVVSRISGRCLVALLAFPGVAGAGQAALSPAPAPASALRWQVRDTLHTEVPGVTLQVDRFVYASGAKSASDDPTIEALPNARRLALSTVYNLINSTEAFFQVALRPYQPLGIGADVHALRLTQAAGAGTSAAARCRARGGRQG